ncbi:MAG: glycosyltransferase family A protein [Ferruginibacter sp.]
MSEASNINSPLVSVLMTAYNRELYIAEAIESVLASAYTNFELIIVDDGSTDKTIGIVQSYKERDNRIRLYINERNLGDYFNRNKAAGYAKGKYLKYLDSDDKIYDYGLGYCVEQMEQHPEAALGLVVLYDMGVDDSVCIDSAKIVRDHFFKRQYLSIGPTGTIIRRDRFIEMNGFDTRFGVASDSFFNIRMASSFPIVLLQRMFVYYREHEGQEKNNRVGYLKFGYLYFKELMERVQLPLTKNEIRYLYKKLKKRHALNLTRYLLETKDIRSVKQVMSETGFGLSDLLAGYFK